MDNNKKKSIRLRILVSAIIYTAVVIITAIGGFCAIRFFNRRLEDITTQDESGVIDTLAGAQDITNTLYITFALIIAGTIAFTIYSMINIDRRIRKPLGSLGRMARHFANTGNLQMSDSMAADISKYEKVNDEVGSVIVSFQMLMDSLLEKVDVLEEVAQGNLRSRVKPLSDEDYLGIAVNGVVSNLGTIVRDVITATEQLSIGAHELSIGAQSLSQSSSEQSATMDRLHETAGEIAAEAVENAERAADASILAGQIRGNATEGGRKMLVMNSAMSEINKASHAIGSVMKAIDDIAFQTNILALNAAVEAARAGMHGKGFAVVADEVRNLATKSGDAANDSNALIADTISKSDLGTKIVSEAIAFFKTIENGIADINDLLDEIAKATKSQSEAIEHVTISLTDMTNVVYHNSATSEQSAAASEQMSSQAMLLKETVNRFSLDEDILPSYSFTHDSLPVAAPVVEKAFPAQEPAFPVQEFPKQEPAFPPITAPLFAAPLYDNDAPAYNPTTAPSEETGGMSPAEIYAEALRREEKDSGLPPVTPAVPHKQYKTEAESGSGFTDDDSKY